MDMNLMEEGAAFRRLMKPERKAYDVIVIGGGQAGLSVGYHLKQRGVDFVILDAHERVGDAWRKRWDSLRLFSPNRYNGLDGMPFPGDADAMPTKDEMADYLERYAARFSLPICSGMRVERLWREGEKYSIRAGGRELSASQVIVAMGNYQQRKVPEFAKHLAPSIVQLHVTEYKNLAQLQPGAVLVVGAANSGAEIAWETVTSHETYLSGPDPGEIPVRHGGFLFNLLFVRFLFRVLFHRLLTLDTPIGKKARPKAMNSATPRIRRRRKDLAAAGIKSVDRTVAVQDGRPCLADGTRLDVANVIWCNGFTPALSFIDLPIFDEEGAPRQLRGIVESEPGLYFVGREFQYAMSSGMVHGVGRDAAQIATAVATRNATVSQQDHRADHGGLS